MRDFIMTFIIAWLSGWLTMSLLVSIWMILVMTRIIHINTDNTRIGLVIRLLQLQFDWLATTDNYHRSGLIIGVMLGNLRTLLFNWPLVLLSLLVVRNREGR
jgi:hypothetical protein